MALRNNLATGKQQAQMKGNLTLMSLAAALILVALIILGLSYAAPSRYYSRIAIGAAIVLLVLRQLTRRRKGARSKAAEPDPESRLNLH